MSALARIEARDAAAFTPVDGAWKNPALSRIDRVRAYRMQFGSSIREAVDAVDEETQRQRFARLTADSAEVNALLQSITADLQQLGHLSRETIRRVCAATSSAVQPPSGLGSSTAEKTPGPASVGSGEHGASS